MKFIKYFANRCSDGYISNLSISSAIMISILCGMALAKIGIILISHFIIGFMYIFFVISSVVALSIFLSGFIESIISKMGE